MIPALKNIIMWALTYRCNMNCDYCFLRDKIKNWNELSNDECIKIAKFISNDKTWRPDAVWLTGGEPTVKSCLTEIVTILEESGIKCVITSNGFCNEQTIDRIISSNPTGINISLESVEDDENNKFRGYTKAVIQNLKKIAEKKSDKTILGVSCVVSQRNINVLYDFAKELKALKVDYLSINPLMNNLTPYKESELSNIIDECKRINYDLNILTPSDFYLDFLKKYFLNQKYDLKCPSGNNFFFISPWGKCYPCSNELWQYSTEPNELIYEYGSIENILAQIRNEFNTKEITTASSCFGDRCIGCWKLYYDTVFTNNKQG